MGTLRKLATDTASQAVSTGIAAGVGASSFFSGLTGHGNAADAEQASSASSGGLLSGVLDRVGQFFGAGSSDQAPEAEAEPTFGGIHDVTEGVEEVEAEFVPNSAPTPYKRALDAFAAGDTDELSKAFAEMKPGGRKALMNNRPDIFRALVDSGDSAAAAFEWEQWETETRHLLQQALFRAERAATGVAEEGWLSYADRRDAKWFQAAREGRKVVVPAHSGVAEYLGVPVHIDTRATGEMTSVTREERFGETDVTVALSWTVSMSVSHEGLRETHAMNFETTAYIGEDMDGRSRSMDPPSSW